MATIESFAEKISKENVWAATNGEIYDYVNASKKLVINSTTVYNPTDIDIYASVNGINTKIRAKSIVYGCIPHN